MLSQHWLKTFLQKCKSMFLNKHVNVFKQASQRFRNMRDSRINKTKQQTMQNINTQTKLLEEKVFMKTLKPIAWGMVFVFARKLSWNQENSAEQKNINFTFIVEHECSICGFYDFSITDDVQNNTFAKRLAWVLKAICQSSVNWL